MAGGFSYDPIKQTTLKPLSACLSGQSVQLVLDLLSWVNDRFQWLAMTDVEWDELEALLAQTEGNLMVNCAIGTLVPCATANLPDNMLWCDGRTYNRVDYPELYDALHSVYHQSADAFRTPSTENKFIRGDSWTGSNVGANGGSDTHTLTSSEMPAHAHIYGQPTLNIDIESVGIPDPTGVGLPMLPTPTDSAGGNGAHNNLPSYHTIRWAVIAR